MLEAVNLNVGRLEEIRKAPMENAIALPLYFNPAVPGIRIDRTKRPIRTSTPPRVTRPENLEDVAYWTIPELASLIRTGQVKSADVVPFDYADYTANPVASVHTSIANMTGQPSVIVPNGFNEKGNPTSLTFAGNAFGDTAMLALAKAYQDATDWHRRHPKLFP